MQEVRITLLTEDQEICMSDILMHHAPRVGEIIWLLPPEKYIHSAFKVLEVAHWVSPESSYVYHHCAVYVKPIKEEETRGNNS